MKFEILGLLLCEFSCANERVIALWSNREFCKLGYKKQSVANPAIWSEVSTVLPALPLHHVRSQHGSGAGARNHGAGQLAWQHPREGGVLHSVSNGAKRQENSGVRLPPGSDNYSPASSLRVSNNQPEEEVGYWLFKSPLRCGTCKREQ